MSISTVARRLPWIGFLCAMLALHFTLFPWFPLENGMAGHDYRYFLPYLLNGYFWHMQNGWGAIPWFTPAFCVGMPFYPNPQSMYYSVPQFLSWHIEPLLSVYFTVLLFAGLGCSGFYWLLRRRFACSAWIAAFGATLFLFNGFYLHRMLVGHLTYHGFMLLPWLCVFLLAPPDGAPRARRWQVGSVLGAALVVAYLAHSGAMNFVVPMVLSATAVLLLHGLCFAWDRSLPWRFLLACVLGVLLAASKWTAAIAFLDHFPRDYYPLPGVEGFFVAAGAVLRWLFWQPSEDAQALLQNTHYEYLQHEFEYGVTPLPLLLFVLFGVVFVLRVLRGERDDWRRLVQNLRRPASLLAVLTFAAILVLPVLVNTWTPRWSEFLQGLPYIRHHSLMLRWIAIDIPPLILLACLAVRALRAPVLGSVVAGVGALTVMVGSLTADRSYYRGQAAAPVRSIIQPWKLARSSDTVPAITHVLFYSEWGLNNFQFLAGVSVRDCYEPIFGFPTRMLPDEGIQTGAIQIEEQGRFNMHNPACLVFDEANQCQPGDNFRSEEKDKMLAFAEYRPFDFVLPGWQKAANWVNLVALLFVLLALPILAWLAWRARRCSEQG